MFKSKILMMVVAVALFSVLLVGCGDSPTPPPADNGENLPTLPIDTALVGEWDWIAVEYQGETYTPEEAFDISGGGYVFNADGTGVMFVEDIETPFTWTATNGVMTWFAEEIGGGTYRVEGNRFYLTHHGSPLTYVYERR